MKSKLDTFPKSLVQKLVEVSSRLVVLFYSKVLVWAAKVLSFLIFVSLRYLINYRRAVIKTNLASSFPMKSGAEIQRLANSYYRHMSDLLIEPFLFYLTPAIARKRLATYTNLELLEGLYRDHKQVIVFASHYGNWEYLINLPKVTSYQVYTAYSPIKNKVMNRLMIGLRSFQGINLIPRKRFYRQGLSLLRECSIPKLLIIIADQRPAPGSNKFYLPFLDQNTAVQIGGERIAMSSDAAVVYVESRKNARFEYDFTFTRMTGADPIVPMSITKSYYTILEKSICLAPCYWLWSHNRWKKASAISDTNPS